MVELLDKNDCTGCNSCATACPKNAIKMVHDNEGFLIPEVDSTLCIDCNICKKSCPISNPLQRNKYDEPIVYAAYNLDEDIRQSSSSGGLFSALTTPFLKEGNCVVAAAFDEHLALHHKIAYSKDDISKMRGSKYVQSQVGDIYKQVKEKLNSGIKVLFVGTPCQVSALYSYMHKDCDNLYTVDLICHGVPSPGLFKHYLQSISINTDEIEWGNYHFRDFFSSGMFVSSLIYPNGKRKTIEINKHSYITAYLKGWLHRRTCYSCHFNGIPRQADVTIGDFWGIMSGKVKYDGTSKNGVSVVLCNTAKGEELFNSVSKTLYHERKTLEDAIVDNHNLIESDNIPPQREYIYEDLKILDSPIFMQKYGLYLPHFTKWQKIKKYIKNTLKIR